MPTMLGVMNGLIGDMRHVMRTNNQNAAQSWGSVNAGLFLFSVFDGHIFIYTMARRQRYGIAFPITIKSGDGSLFDTSDDLVGCVTSEMMHVLFTPKGQRLRDPEFGTELIQYIFNPNDNQTWGDVKHEIKSTVSRYVPDCTVKDVEIAESDDGRELYARIIYSIKQDGTYKDYQTITKL